MLASEEHYSSSAPLQSGNKLLRWRNFQFSVAFTICADRGDKTETVGVGLRIADLP
jgi:hypothetical protein